MHHDDHVTKRGTPRMLTYSPTEKVLPKDAQIIDALHGTDAIDTNNIDVEFQEKSMTEGEDGTDLLGKELLEMEARNTHTTEGDKAKTNEALRGKPRHSSTHRRGGRSRIPMGIQRKKGEFLRRGSPRSRRSSKNLPNTNKQ
ncbi:unnamed protein product [Eruca vesicaria subsp. sativa]|uniref:Uncharacterized protein n=1 Tax=Eruca vesicaria subsp. sativa TaxID=29727 RepID=A0ABC8KA97_ERUVS|nr:unnamed protein product [Eruca vesicaria subsp. sativa]